MVRITARPKNLSRMFDLPWKHEVTAAVLLSPSLDKLCSSLVTFT